MAQGAKGNNGGYALAIGDKNYSSWSLRPWLAMRMFGIPFEEVKIRLRQPDTATEIAKHSPSGKIPALRASDLVVWDSLAILEYLADQHREHRWWPSEGKAKALARAVSAEMHSGFAPLREVMPMDFVERKPMRDVPQMVQDNIRRIIALWRQCRSQHGEAGPYLFGAFSIADAMYAPVASRLRTYEPDLEALGDDGTAAAYRDALFAMPQMEEWAQGAREELAERGAF